MAERSLAPDPWWMKSGFRTLVGGAVTSLGAVILDEMTLRAWIASVVVALGAFIVSSAKRPSVATKRIEHEANAVHLLLRQQRERIAILEDAHR